MLYVCVRGVMDIVFSVCIVMSGALGVSTCRCCMFVSCAYPVVVLNAVFCMTCSLLMLVEDARGDHMEEVYSSAGLCPCVVSVVMWSSLVRLRGCRGTLCGCGSCYDCDACIVVCVAWVYAERVWWCKVDGNAGVGDG